ncbi:hypothetical protein C1646_670319 [Rhizophagus diaphanus]|nr:hypothetical protein C1646_670319 [Rhizophagus diaphanus] [Rhizophagus sp. MUCL 43196]
MSHKTILRHPGYKLFRQPQNRRKSKKGLVSKKVIEGGEKWKALALKNIEDNNNTEIYIKNEFKGYGDNSYTKAICTFAWKNMCLEKFQEDHIEDLRSLLRIQGTCGDGSSSWEEV